VERSAIDSLFYCRAEEDAFLSLKAAGPIRRRPTPCRLIG
jgi:hypothetical protein